MKNKPIIKIIEFNIQPLVLFFVVEKVPTPLRYLQTKDYFTALPWKRLSATIFKWKKIIIFNNKCHKERKINVYLLFSFLTQTKVIGLY